MVILQYLRVPGDLYIDGEIIAARRFQVTQGQELSDGLEKRL